jgi:RNA polymerase sigma-70 factor (ECF subfamily)
VHKYEKVIYHLAFRLGGEREAADLTQEIFLRVLEGIHSFRMEQRFFPWFYSLALNHLRSHARRSYLKRVFFSREPEQGLTPEQTASISPPNPEAETEGREVLRSLEKAVSRLPYRMREIFLLREIEGLSYNEIASLLGLPIGVLKVRANRARQRIFAELNKMGVTFSPERNK